MTGWGCPACGHAKAGHDERGCPGCACTWRFVPGPVPPGGEEVRPICADCEDHGDGSFTTCRAKEVPAVTPEEMSAYVAAAMVTCPRCGARIGSPCRVRKCRNGYRNCTYAACSVLVELPEPHLERAVKARQEVEAAR